MSEVYRGLERRRDIDGLKAFAIIAVVLYHMGVVTYGYLGVDVFFVLSGYLLMKSLEKATEGRIYHYFRELCHRLIRLYPLIIIAVCVCLILGYFTMLPDDYESLAQSIIATNTFANNILAYITTGNYWEVVNELKPLMHTWYLGVLVQFYVVFLFVFKIVVVSTKEDKRNCVLTCVLLFLTVVSLVLFLYPKFNDNLKFYMMPFRMFELTSGCLAAYLYEKIRKGGGRALWIALPVAVLLILMPVALIPDNLRLLAVVLCTICLVLYKNQSMTYRRIISNQVVCVIGRASFSIYIWHQIMLAFTRYTLIAKLNVLGDILFLLAVAAISTASYIFIEKRLGKVISRHFRRAIVIIATSVIVVSMLSFTVYLRAGVVRDIPELDIRTDDIKKGMHSQYNHRIYDLENKMFDGNRINVLIVGNSFARDWANVVLESEIGDKIDISYAFSWSESLIPLIEDADYVFVQGLLKEEIPSYVWRYAKDSHNVWGLGVKRFGDNNGIIYSQRHKPDYLDMRVMVPASVLKENTASSISWGCNFIDFISTIQNNDGTVPVFTPNGKYISQDCRHLTKAGAAYYAEVFDIGAIFSQ